MPYYESTFGRLQPTTVGDIRPKADSRASRKCGLDGAWVDLMSCAWVPKPITPINGLGPSL